MSVDKVKVYNSRNRAEKVEHALDMKRRKEVLEKYLNKEQITVKKLCLTL